MGENICNVKFRSNKACTVVIDGEEVLSLEAKKVAVHQLPYGDYFIGFQANDGDEIDDEEYTVDAPSRLIAIKFEETEPQTVPQQAAKQSNIELIEDKTVVCQRPPHVDVAQLRTQAESAFNQCDYATAAKLYCEIGDDVEGEDYYHIGVMFRDGLGCEANVDAVKVLNEGIEKGVVSCIAALGLCYERGFGVPQNLMKAVKLYADASEKGCALGSLYLGNCYKNGIGVPINPRKALVAYTKAAEKGDVIAMNFVGAAYENGDGADRNYATAALWYKKAAEKGDAKAICSLATLFLKGDGVKRNPQKAFALYKMAAEKGDACAMFNLAFCYNDGIGVAPDAAEGLEWMYKAAEAGEVRAMFNLGNYYDRGEGVPADKNQAMTWFSRAAELGDVRAIHNLGMLYDEVGNHEKAFECFSVSARKGSLESAFSLGCKYICGEGTSTDYSEGAKWLKIAADAGNEQAQHNLNILYKQGVIDSSYADLKTQMKEVGSILLNDLGREFKYAFHIDDKFGR